MSLPPVSNTVAVDPSSVFLTLLLRCHQVAKSLSAGVRLTPDELYCLCVIHLYHPACIKDLSGLLRARGPRTSRLLGNLEAKGLLRRTMNPHDHRREEVLLTKNGTAAVRQVLELAGQLVGELESAGRESCLPALAHIIDHLRIRLPEDSGLPSARHNGDRAWMLLPDEE